MIIQDKKEIRWSYTPLSVTCSVTDEGGLGTSQTYDGSTGEYTPDHTITPLVLMPLVYAVNPDEMGEPQPVNPSLANVQWGLLGRDDSVRPFPAALPGMDPLYEYVGDGEEDAGKLIVRANVNPRTPQTLIFKAEYADVRMNQVHKIRATITLECTDQTNQNKLVVDVADQVFYDPINMEPEMTIRAEFYSGQTKKESPQVEFRWYVMRTVAPDGTMSFGEYGESIFDNFMQISADGSEVTLKRDIMAEREVIRCGAFYDEGGDIDQDTPMTAHRDFSVERRLPRMNLSQITPHSLRPGMTEICTEAVVRYGKMDYTGDATKRAKLLSELDFTWRMAPKHSMTSGVSESEYVVVGKGLKPTIAIEDRLEQPFGGGIKVEAVDRGNWKYWADADGTLLTDSDGSLLMIR